VGSAVGGAVGDEELEAHMEGDWAGEAVAVALVEEEGLEACEGHGMGVEVVQRVGERVEEELCEAEAEADKGGEAVGGAEGAEEAEAAGETLGEALGVLDAVKRAVAEAGEVPLAVL